MTIGRFRSLIVIMGLLVTASLVANASEVEGPNHQDEIHHCAVCCVNHNTAAPVAGVRFQPVVIAASRLPIEPDCLVSQTVIRRLVPPPKFLA